MEKNLDDYKDLGELESLKDKGTIGIKQGISNFGNLYFKVFVVVSIIVVIYVLFLILFGDALKDSGIIEFISEYNGLLFLLVIFLLCFLMYYFSRSFYAKRRGRNYFKLYINNLSEENVKSILNDCFSNLYYKEINYHGENVYYAYKVKYSSNISSLKRYMKIFFKDNYLLIESWITIRGVDIPIIIEDNIPNGISYLNSVMINDLQYIRDSIITKKN